jgi:hypothetical protein
VPETHVDMRRQASILDAEPMTPLDALRDELRPVQVKPIDLACPARSTGDVTYAVRYGLAVEGPRLAAWRRACVDEFNKDANGIAQVDEFLWGRTICAAQCLAILRNGKPLVSTDGQHLTFRHAELQELVGVVPDTQVAATEAVRRFYNGNDFDTSAAAAAILDAAGWGRTAKEVDPTKGPSAP